MHSIKIKTLLLLQIALASSLYSDDALHKEDSLLKINKEKEEPALLEKLLLQMNQKRQESNHSKKMFTKPLHKSDELNTPDPLLDDI
jgi:hypothetical protein